MLEIKNRKINDFEVESKITAGIILVGMEIKSLIKKEVDITGSRCMLQGSRGRRAAMLVGSYFKPLESHFSTKYEANRERQLLFNKNELNFLEQEIQKNRVLIPTRIYLPGNSKKYKVEIAICRPLKKWDKRNKEKEKESNKEIKKEEY